MKTALLVFVSFLMIGFLAAGCNSEKAVDNPVSPGSSLSKNNQLQVELSRVRAATAKYHNIAQADSDGYVDINLPIPHMGWHYLKSALLDSTFDMEHPELLVYMNKPGGGYQLVAVEYAVPLSMSANAPEGFTGDEDVWDVNTQFQLWTLHAWVWYHNPDGMFAPFNPRVPE